MSGVEILAFEEVAVEWAGWSWSGFWTAIGVVSVIAVFAGVIFGLVEDDIVAFIIAFLAVLILGGGMAGVAFGKCTAEPTKYETHYKVTVDESVSMIEFNKKYEVLEQEGKIYTVRERE